jgi:hypothetical protein
VWSYAPCLSVGANTGPSLVAGAAVALAGIHAPRFEPRGRLAGSARVLRRAALRELEQLDSDEA